MLRLVAGLDSPTSGKVLVDGLEVRGPSRSCGLVFQAPSLLPWRTAIRNVELSLELQGLNRNEIRTRAAESLDLVGLTRFRHARPFELSGGMQQRVNLARALAVGPHVLLMDEPFSALDAMTKEDMQRDLLKLHRNLGKTVLFVTHDLDEAVLLADRIFVMDESPGRVVHKIEIRIDRELRQDPVAVKASETFVEYRHALAELFRRKPAIGGTS